MDLSGGGFQFNMPVTLKVGDSIAFELELDPGRLVISGTGKVVRIGQRGRVAVTFDGVSEHDREHLIHFIFEVLRTQLKLRTVASG